MSITTYSELQAAVADWAKRTDLTSVIPDFITLAETRIKSLLNINEQELNAALTTTPSVDFVALPADCKTPIALWLTDVTPYEPLTQVLPQSLDYSTIVQRPQHWAVDGANIKFAGPVNAAIPLQLRYIQNLSLSNSSPTNSIFTKYPDVYLFGALFELADYAQDDQNAMKWDGKFMGAIQRANDLEAQDNKYTPLRTEIPLAANQRFNINRGY